MEDRFHVTFTCHWIINVQIQLIITLTVLSIFISDIRSDNKLHAVGPLMFLPCSVRGLAVFANTVCHLIALCVGV